MKRPAAFMVLAGVAAVLASVLVYSALKKREAEVKQAMASTVEIVVAAHDLPLGTKIDPTAVKMARWSRDSMPPGAITNTAAVIGSFVKSSMVENEPVVPSKLFNGAKTAGVLPLLIPPGMRAMSVPVDEVSDIAGFVLPHSRVDVLVALSNTGGANQKAISKVVLQDVEVLAVAQEVEGKKDEPQVVKVVTLLVTPQQAENLTLASHEGTLRLAMRNFSDDKIVMTSGADIASLLRSYGGAIPVMAQQPAVGRMAAAPRPRPAVKIEIMRDGKTRQAVSFITQAAIGPTSEKRLAAAAIKQPAKAIAENDSDNDDDAADRDAETAAPATPAPKSAGKSAAATAGYIPIPKTIDVP